jgi:Golgi phosphoprotein 3 (GPP34)
MAKRPLVQELMLLGLDDGGRVVGRNPGFDYALAGAVLLELALAERIDVADKRVVPLPGASLREPVLDDALTAIERDKRRRAKDWIPRLSRSLRKRILADLVRGGLTGMQITHVLKVFPSTRYPVTDAAALPELRASVVAAVRGTDAVQPRTAALCSLIGPAGLGRRLFPDVPRRELRRRLNEISGDNWASEAVRVAVREVQAATAAVAAAVAGGAVASGG